MELASLIIQSGTLIVITVTALYILRQSREAGRQALEANAIRRLDAMLRVHKLMSTTDARKDRACLYSAYEQYEGDIPTDLPQQQKERIERVCVESDIIGALVSHKLVPEDDLLETHWDVFIKTWKAAQAFVARKQAGKDGRYVHYVPMFKTLYTKAEEYRHSKGLPEPTLAYEEAAN